MGVTLVCVLLSLHQGLFKSTIINPQVVLGLNPLPVRLLVRPVLERRNVVISQYLVILLETGKMSIENGNI